MLATCEIDERTWRLVVRADVGLGAALALERRLLGLRLTGVATIIIDLGDADAITNVLRATLMRSRRKLAERDGRLVVSAEHPAVRGRADGPHRAPARATVYILSVDPGRMGTRDRSPSRGST